MSIRIAVFYILNSEMSPECSKLICVSRLLNQLHLTLSSLSNLSVYRCGNVFIKIKVLLISMLRSRQTFTYLPHVACILFETQDARVHP